MILFIDDDKFGAKPFQLELEDAGYKVAMAGDPDEAMEIIRKDTKGIELIIMDVMMPPGKMFTPEASGFGLSTGYLLLEVIKRDCPGIPVIVFSIRNATDLKSDYRVLYKMDVMPRDLVAEVRSALGAK